MGKKPNFSLIGFMGSGKTSSGQELARLLDFDFFDSDQLTQNETGLTIREIFEKYGEKEFREMEKAQIGKIKAMRKTVWATGGGSWLDPLVRATLMENSWSVWLKVSGDQSWRRVSSHLAQRPLLSKAADPMSEIEKKLKERNAVYSLADYSVSTDDKTPREVAAEILELIKKDNLVDLL
jgi:shikimate kinase